VESGGTESNRQPLAPYANVCTLLSWGAGQVTRPAGFRRSLGEGWVKQTRPARVARATKLRSAVELPPSRIGRDGVEPSSLAYETSVCRLRPSGAGRVARPASAARFLGEDVSGRIGLSDPSWSKGRGTARVRGALRTLPTVRRGECGNRTHRPAFAGPDRLYALALGRGPSVGCERHVAALLARKEAGKGGRFAKKSRQRKVPEKGVWRRFSSARSWTAPAAVYLFS
jgi:hypothetical protein